MSTVVAAAFLRRDWAQARSYRFGLALTFLHALVSLALFFYVGWQLRNDIARSLGCRLRDDGSIDVDSQQATTVDRVYAAGNCADPRALVPTAAGSGVTAAVAINVRLSLEDADRAVGDSGAPAPAAEAR